MPPCSAIWIGSEDHAGLTLRSNVRSTLSCSGLLNLLHRLQRKNLLIPSAACLRGTQDGHQASGGKTGLSADENASVRNIKSIRRSPTWEAGRPSLIAVLSECQRAMPCLAVR